ncbi:hypothetical protein scyTo_0023824, partial [Scyliorhinus torazame]|nr:hypothetical protein [Scyliorhinus torazame]
IWQKGISTQHTPTTSDTSDMPIKLENPYKEPPKRCVLCGIPVDYRNTQVCPCYLIGYWGRHA